MSFFIMLDNDDGSTEEIELKNGCVYCKCPKCGKNYFRVSRNMMDSNYGKLTLIVVYDNINLN